MNRMDFASLGSSAFAIVVKKRQALVAADKVLDAADDDYFDNCHCFPRRLCACGRREVKSAASQARSDAYHDLREAEAMWAQFCEIRESDMR